MARVVWHGVDGSVWPLTEHDHRGVFLREGTVELARDDEGVIAGSLDLVVADHLPDGSLVADISSLMRAWRRSWSLRKDGTLVVSSGSGRFTARLRAGGVVGALPDDDVEGFEEFSQPVSSLPGTWWTRRVGVPGPRAVVLNAGVVEAWVSVWWLSGGELVQPSGAVVRLPDVPGGRTIILDPAESCVVVDDDGVVDMPLWRSLRASVFPEPVPAGEKRVFMVPAGAHVFLDERVDDPWA